MVRQARQLYYPNFRYVNPISIRRGRLCPPIGFASPKFFHDYAPEYTVPKSGFLTVRITYLKYRFWISRQTLRLPKIAGMTSLVEETCRQGRGQKAGKTMATLYLGGPISRNNCVFTLFKLSFQMKSSKKQLFFPLP